MPRHLYRSSVVCGVCGISQRVLDYWVQKGVVAPSRYGEHLRRLHFFSADDIVRASLAKSMRDAGVPLQRVRRAIKVLKQTHGDRWTSAWIVTDGRTVFEACDDPAEAVKRASQRPEQHAFSIVAVDRIRKRIRDVLRRVKPEDMGRYRGVKLHDWDEQREAM